MQSSNPRAVLFGKAIADLRTAKGFTQGEMVGRLFGYYSSERTYARVEQGGRVPERDNVLRIAVNGLLITESATINSLLAMAGYEGLSRQDVQKFQINAPVDPSISILPDYQTIPAWINTRTSMAAFLISVAVSATLSLLLIQNHIWIALLTSALYAGLFSLSVSLETAYLPDQRGLLPIMFLLWSFIFATSVATVALLAVPGRAGESWGLEAAVTVAVLIATLQWAIVRSVLPSSVLIRARIQLMTPQVAHLKNTLYFLFIALFFWLPCLNTVFVLERLAGHGDGALVRDLVSRPVIIMAHGAVSLNALPLAGLLVLVIGVTIPMGARLSDNLKPDSKLNSFQTRFYFRALLAFSLAFICVGWYFSVLSQWS